MAGRPLRLTLESLANSAPLKKFLGRPHGRVSCTPPSIVVDAAPD